MSIRARKRSWLSLVAVGALVASVTAAGPAAADPNNNSPKKLTKAVTVEGVMEHLTALQAVSDANGGDRAAGRSGYAASVDYVVDRLTDAGYTPTVQAFEFPYFEENSELQQLTPTPITYVNNRDFNRNGFVPTFIGEATGVVTPVDVVLPPPPTPNSNSSGCTAADFAGFPAGNIALLQRGTCGFNVKALNAQAANASAVILFNEGQPGRTGLVTPVGDTPGLAIPVVFATFETGNALAAPGPRTARVKVDFLAETRTAWNVFAESDEGNPNNVVMAGAHLDSVQDGPGINDNGTGSAAILEVAEQMAKVKTNSKVRFAWWGAEEEGLLGSEYYIANLSQAEQDKIALYLNFDMVGSPNHFFGIYDGDNSGGTAPPGFIPPGSAQIEDVFEKFYADRGLPKDDTEFSGRSDYGPFIAVDIPAGGLFTGAEGVKTAEQASRYGGTAGLAYDPCYHQPCDDIDNLNLFALDVNADAIATAVITFAFDTSTVNGVRAPGKSHGAGNSEHVGEAS
ncbi:M28 family metallopeptidase [Actinokineospora sp. HUAS TT18]|uniref:M28 family metallopeptidase n=1 Tax=Actinokineospora sp. HUAS TT18 TaxID=3447451 RepID=UPI003F524DD2